MVSRAEKSLMAERKRLEDKQYDLNMQLQLVNERIDRIDKAIDALHEPLPAAGMTTFRKDVSDGDE